MNNLPCKLREEASKLPIHLNDATIALAHYVSCIGGQLTRTSSGKWQPKEKNFITFKPQHLRAKDIALTLRGNPSEFRIVDNVTIKNDQNGYSRCNIKDANQIAAMFIYTRLALDIYERGPTRTIKTKKILG